MEGYSIPVGGAPLTLAEQLALRVKAAKEKPYTKAWEKAQRYVLANADKGFESCTLPPISDAGEAKFVADKFFEEGIQCTTHNDSGTYLVKVTW